MIIVALILLLIYAVFFIYSCAKVLQGNFTYLLIYTVTFLPVYALFLTFNFDHLESAFIIKLVQYSKELLFFGTFAFWIIGAKKVVNKEWHISFLDWIFIAFLGLATFFFLSGLGDATLMNRAIYLKNIFLIGLFYFFGRQFNLSTKDWGRAFNIIFVITVLASGLVIMEKLAGVHFHSLVGYAKYNLLIKGEEPGGIYGLAYTFEAEGGRPRYGAFFANPLELSSSMLISLSLCVIYLISVPLKTNQYKYLIVLLSAFICVLLAYSRASFVSFFMMLVFMAFLLRYYKILGMAALAVVFVVVYVLFFAADEVRYFIEDTITFQNSSSVTHIIDWLNAVESMISNPLGIGLAMSGNAGGVEKDLIVGGENQYLIYGVQMGFLGMFLYIGMLLFGIRNSWRAFRLSENVHDRVIPFVAATVKFGLLLPLFTANAEAYIYVSLVSWMMIGHAETQYQMVRNVRKKGLSGQPIQAALG